MLTARSSAEESGFDKARNTLGRVKAVVIEQPHEVSYRDVEAPTCGPGDVLVRSRLAGVCRTDLEVLEGALDRRWVRYPCIPGHEWSGLVEAVGEGVVDLEPGDRVACEGFCYCGTCKRCRAGDTHLCERYDCLGFTRGGGYGELVLVPRRVVHRLPDSVPLEAAVLIEPASVVLKGLLQARPQAGEAVGVIGVGTLGALAIVLARLYSPGAVVAYGLRDEELELARRLGATETVNVSSGADQHVGQLDLVVETAGAVAALELATRLPREGGRAVLLGIAGEGSELRLPADRIVLRDLELIGSVGYTSAVWGQVVELLGAGIVDLAPIVTHRFPAERFEDAFRLLVERDGIVGKVLLEHPGT
jgi:2-desacetyl-2-hydroxyethyl bacteriochlorophyllide A dehydrogenase